jgi:hypothetical protein
MIQELLPAVLQMDKEGHRQISNFHHVVPAEQMVNSSRHEGPAEQMACRRRHRHPFHKNRRIRAIGRVLIVISHHRQGTWFENMGMMSSQEVRTSIKVMTIHRTNSQAMISTVRMLLHHINRIMPRLDFRKEALDHISPMECLPILRQCDNTQIGRVARRCHPLDPVGWTDRLRSDQV